MVKFQSPPKLNKSQNGIQFCLTHKNSTQNQTNDENEPKTTKNIINPLNNNYKSAFQPVNNQQQRLRTPPKMLNNQENLNEKNPPPIPPKNERLRLRFFY